jgi:hypothetical protein
MKAALFLALLIGLGFGFSGCSQAGTCQDAEGHWGECKQVQVWSAIDNAPYTETRLQGALRKDDGIVVNVYEDKAHPLGPAITIVDRINHPIIVMSKDHWLDNETAADFANEGNQGNDDHVTKVIKIIKMIHHWQDTHPRSQAAPAPAPASVAAPVTVTKTVAPPGPPPAPAPSKPILGPFMYWVTRILVVAFAVVVLAAAAMGGMDLREWAVRRLRKSRHDAEVAKAEHEAQLAAIAAKCERDNADYISGKTDVYGDYRPSNL